MTTAYWWEGDARTGHVTNLGDQFTPLLLSHFSDVHVQWAPPAESDVIGCGSVLDVMPRSGWTGYVLGAGQLHESTITDLSRATVLGLRGYLTSNRVVRAKHAKVCIGDPALLASELATPKPNKYPIGLVAHLTDDELYPRELERARKYGYAEPHLIDITDDPIQVITEIGSCRKVIASALHAIIVADAFHIPRRAEPFPAMIHDAVHEGGIFKWQDYGSAIGQTIEFGKLQTAPKLRVQQMQYDLFQMFTTFKGLLNVL